MWKAHPLRNWTRCRIVQSQITTTLLNAVQIARHLTNLVKCARIAHKSEHGPDVNSPRMKPTEQWTLRISLTRAHKGLYNLAARLRGQGLEEWIVTQLDLAALDAKEKIEREKP